MLFTNSDKWNELTETLENVLNSFQSNSNFNDTEIQLEDDSFFAKYLTSSKLFQLEVRIIIFLFYYYFFIIFFSYFILL